VQNQAASIWDLAPYLKGGKQPVLSGGQQLPEASVDGRSRGFLVDGPFAYYVGQGVWAGRMRVFDLR